MSRPRHLLVPLLTLVGSGLVSPTLLACEPLACDPTAPVYARDVAPITLTQGTTVQVPIVLTSPSFPTGATLLELGLLHCAAAPVTQAEDTRARGTFRVLDAEGAPLRGMAEVSMAQSITGWCLSERAQDADTLPAIPASAFDCTSSPCTASLTIEIVPSVAIAADEIEARLHDGTASCSGSSFARTTTQIERFGP